MSAVIDELPCMMQDKETREPRPAWKLEEDVIAADRPRDVVLVRLATIVEPAWARAARPWRTFKEAVMEELP